MSLPWRGRNSAAGDMDGLEMGEATGSLDRTNGYSDVALEGSAVDMSPAGARPGALEAGQEYRLACFFLVLVPALLVFAGYWAGSTQQQFVTGCAGISSAAAGDTAGPEGSIVGGFAALHDYRGRPRRVAVAQGVVTADHGRCSDVGLDVLREGGNAVDGAVAAALCQGVLNPMASGAGGGHFMLIRLPNGTAEVIDAREVAPLASNETMFVGRPDASLNGGLAVAVPLELKGLHLAHTRHGVLPGEQTAKLAAWPLLADTFLFREGRRWRAPHVNETCCRRPQLAQLLRDVAADGPDVLYRGKYAAGLAADIAAAGGGITVEDLQRAEAQLKQPLRASAFGLDILAVPPPSSAAAVVAALRILEGYRLPLGGSGTLGLHRTVEALKHALAMRMSLGDPGPPSSPFINLTATLQDMLDGGYAEQLRQSTSDDDVLPLSSYGGQAYSVFKSGVQPGRLRCCVWACGQLLWRATSCDRRLLKQSVLSFSVFYTFAVNTGFGSKVVSPSTGLLLNNQMDDFSSPGQANVYGLVPSRNNLIAPGRKPLSSMSPIIVEQQGQLRMVVGASGGPRIISSVLQALLRVLVQGLDPFAAVGNPRLHHQLAPNNLYAEQWNTTGVAFHYDEGALQIGGCACRALARFGHNTSATNWGGVTQAVVLDLVPGGGAAPMLAVSDPRKDGAPAGY
eukprot:scaffold17.g435.t1